MNFTSRLFHKPKASEIQPMSEMTHHTSLMTGTIGGESATTVRS